MVIKALKAGEDTEIVLSVDDKPDKEVLAVLVALKFAQRSVPTLEGDEDRAERLLKQSGDADISSLVYLLGGDLSVMQAVSAFIDTPIYVEEIDLPTFETRIVQLHKGHINYG